MRHTLRYFLGAVAALALTAPAMAGGFGTSLVANGLNSPLLVTHAGDGSGRLFIVQQDGRVRIYNGSSLETAPFINIGSGGLGLTTGGGERGLLGMAFHPDYASNGRFFLSYTQSSGGASVVSEFAVSGDPNVADTGSEDIIIGPISQPASNHNGGMIAFGPDGMLYYALGDGGSAGDPFGTIGNGQDTTTLLGSILRLDVDSPPDPGLNYAIPADNPFVGGTGPSPSTREEIYAYGLRNTWRFSFDRGTGQLFAGDVGQGSLEEVDIIVSGGNYGWRRMEGTACFNPSSGCQTGSLILPITQYSNTGFGGDCSITGGYVYRGSNYPPIQGNYFYGDYCSGRVWMAEEVSPGVWTDTQILNTTFEIAGFGEDEDGEIYICDIGGGAIYQLTGPVPVALSSFGLE